MASSYHFNMSTCSRFNIMEDESDIQVFVKEYRYLIKEQLQCEEDNTYPGLVSFADTSFQKDAYPDIKWMYENNNRFLDMTPNFMECALYYLSEYGYITCMTYSPDGEIIIVGHSTGYIQEYNPNPWYPMFYKGLNKFNNGWIKDNYKKFLQGTPNGVLYDRWYFSELGAITALVYSPNGFHIIVGHSSGAVQVPAPDHQEILPHLDVSPLDKDALITDIAVDKLNFSLHITDPMEMRHGSTGSVLCTLRNMQFPPKPIYALLYSQTEERICYAACTDGVVYRIEIPNISTSLDDPPEYCIRADPALESLHTQFYGSPGTSSSAIPFIINRSPALCLGVTAAAQPKMVIGYGDGAIKVHDLETQEAESTYVVHKLRLQFIPKKLQRMHGAQVCALRCHAQNPFMFASGGWDNTLRIWDTRCKVGCMMTFEGVNICSDSIDLNRDHCLVGSWQPTEALTEWDLKAKKKICTVRVQNRRPDVDGEYIYACQYWKSQEFNRKGKYGIIGGSGTNCVEVINLHNRYITCSYPVSGTILAITSYNERIAFGGTAPIFNLVQFHDPKHENYDDIGQDSDGADLMWLGSVHKSAFLKVGIKSKSSTDRASIDSQNFSTTIPASDLSINIVE